MQILAVDLGTDLVPALALGVEQPEPGLMASATYREEHVITPYLLRRAYSARAGSGVLAMAAFICITGCTASGDRTDLPNSGALPRGNGNDTGGYCDDTSWKLAGSTHRA